MLAPLTAVDWQMLIELEYRILNHTPSCVFRLYLHPDQPATFPGEWIALALSGHSAVTEMEEFLLYNTGFHCILQL